LVAAAYIRAISGDIMAWQRPDTPFAEQKEVLLYRTISDMHIRRADDGCVILTGLLPPAFGVRL